MTAKEGAEPDANLCIMKPHLVLQRKVAFGSCQERPIFPTKYAHDRMGNKMLLKGPPHLGPGCYDSHNWGTIAYELKRPISKGYTLASRTSIRFPDVKESTSPSPQTYQQDWVKPRRHAPSKVPFHSSEPRFRSAAVTQDITPGPGSYSHDTVQDRKVVWPMKFGATNWDLVVQPKKVTLRTEAPSERDFKKQRDKVAQLSLYYP
ncbi:ciliary microtubule-associated protein 3-like isoform X1 [Conger conger]|uniref:ciliary microtubule-associated protein 3-like isoform X1 n=1 Tax=Conger conger TaxID=82655 RepID=UPI002A5AA111|nr:ciliary microtubule-associated protein 3-like isoform X1 [Conger conger]